MKNKLGILHKFAYSLFDFKIYREFLSQGLLKAIFYLFLMTTIFSTLSNISTLNVFNDDMTRLENKYIKESPEFELKDGNLNINLDGPVIYKYTGDSPILQLLINYGAIGDVLVADTSGTTDISILDDYSSGTYINASSISFKKQGKIIANINFSDNKTLSVNKELLIPVFSSFKTMFTITFFILNPLLSFINNLAALFIIIGPMTFLMRTNSKHNLKYSQCCIIGAYSMTLPLIFESLVTITGIFTSEYTFVFYVISMLYCTLALRNIESTKKIDTVL
ncbi:DUF1189 domain-containing protein [uncultured Clostridium sp.]|uniref:DUF1189 domain-containing protein n=1 Tax=uncultured Clostridium sp. TaxID=59620 RepID=UPI0025E43D38|nr:DUF1189 domain-containing protein [uncultured Clostridium sp.]